MTGELAGQTVVVIGGSSGMGLETARRAREEGAEVILTGRNAEHLKQAAADVGTREVAAFDVTDPAALDQFFADLPGPIDHLYMTAGGRGRLRRHAPVGPAAGRRPGGAPRAAARHSAHRAGSRAGRYRRAGRAPDGQHRGYRRNL